MRIIAKAPCRVDLAGGTLDIWPLYLFHANPVTVNFAVNRYTTCVLETRNDGRIHLASHDLKQTEQFGSLAELRAAKKYKLPLTAYILRFFRPETGLNVYTDSEAPAGAGISGSSSLIISTTSATNRLTNAGYKIEQLREISQNIEAQIIRVPTGCQDYYPAMYGGISAIQLGPAGIRRTEIKIPHEELNRRFVLAYTGAPRNSGINNWEVTKAHIDGDRQVHKNFDKIAAIASGMRRAVERQDWAEMGRLLREEWTNRRKNAPGITTPLIDRLIEVTRKAGSTGAKVCGAGGGGCVLFLVEPDAKDRVARAIEAAGAEVLDVTVAPRGVRVLVEQQAQRRSANAG
jgi:D-glycero-alpha-D-manno-heptose-7-phosphate kinase